VLDDLLILDAAHIYGTIAFAIKMNANKPIKEITGGRQRTRDVLIEHDNGRTD